MVISVLVSGHCGLQFFGYIAQRTTVLKEGCISISDRVNLLPLMLSLARQVKILNQAIPNNLCIQASQNK